MYAYQQRYANLTLMVGIHYGFSTNFYSRNLVSETLFLKPFPIHYRNKVSQTLFAKLYFRNFSTIHYGNKVSETKFLNADIASIHTHVSETKVSETKVSQTLFAKLFADTHTCLGNKSFRNKSFANFICETFCRYTHMFGKQKFPKQKFRKLYLRNFLPIHTIASSAFYDNFMQIAHAALTFEGSALPVLFYLRANISTSL